jgi:hypothetical protein
MKRTDLQKRERELKRSQKKEERLVNYGDKSDKSIGDYIKELHGLFFFDETKIYNTKESMEILELFEEMQGSFDKTQCETIIRKAVRQSGVKEKEPAVNELLALLAE